jgi:hypothetical protein
MPTPAHLDDRGYSNNTTSAIAPSIPVIIPSPTLLTPVEDTPAALPIRPVALHTESFASSVFSNDSEGGDPAAYDVLSSSPESEGGFPIDHEPLLRAEAPVARRTETGLSQL